MTCIDGYSFNGSTCDTCVSPCKTCLDYDVNSCTDCIEGKYLSVTNCYGNLLFKEIILIDCTPPCLNCVINPTTCTSCQP